ncbi:MAG TPA: Rne/Rng family ribonuclease [Thermoanaerobaculia bacterium]|nr:Rne/Rng family ribonuclease [Thermoanaerobaculia bacterium]HUM30522.1 Rne/Rng family ribonuclease [Thermoanaerobaculia bacterium]HXK68714.1 Rne/Rng family ribonuclease [Thermoanaerobaculia bacterium]
MRCELYFNITPGLTRAALVEEGKLVELFVEFPEQRSIVGNIYRVSVRKIVPGISCAFVNMGHERDGFLYVDDVVEDADSWEEIFKTDEENHRSRSRQSISALLRTGQSIVVQVIRDPLPNKGPRVTSQLALPGKYMVFIPGRSFVGVSKKIEDHDERKRLKTIAQELADSINGGIIIRTAADRVSRENLETDAAYLKNLWQSIHEKSSRAPVPSLLHKELPLPLKLVRDMATEDLARIVVDDRLAFEEINTFLKLVPSHSPPEVRLHEAPLPLFEMHDIEKEISKAMKPKVWLKHGGYLVINQTEALVAIDVNSGKFISRGDLEDTAYRTNLEAVSEIVRQIRLRNLGGILVLDLIDMERENHRKAVLEKLEEELIKDRAHSKLLAISSFGLVEMTRKRTKENVVAQLTSSCEYCSGSGRIKNLTMVCLELYNEIKKAAGPMVDNVMVKAHPLVIETFRNEWLPSSKDPLIGRLNFTYKEDLRLHIEEFQIVVT